MKNGVYSHQEKSQPALQARLLARVVRNGTACRTVYECGVMQPATLYTAVWCTQVPPISGSSSRVGYAITNLDLSGFRLRKEDVEVQLVDLSGGLEVAVKEGGAGNTNTNTNTNGVARSDGTPPGGGRGSANSGRAGGAGAAGGVGGGAAGGEDLAAVPWATSSVDGAPSSAHPGEGRSLVSSPEQRRQAAYATVLGGAGSRLLPEELEVSWNHGGGEEFDGRAGGVVGEDGGGGLVHPPGPPPKEEMAPAEVLRVVARGVRAEFKTLQWACRQVNKVCRKGLDVCYCFCFFLCFARCRVSVIAVLYAFSVVGWRSRRIFTCAEKMTCFAPP